MGRPIDIGGTVADTDVLLEIDGPIAVVTNNRPEVHNAASDAFADPVKTCPLCPSSTT